MYTKRPVWTVLKWTRRHIFLFIILAAIPVVLFYVLQLKWLHAPWLPFGVLGTAVAFIIDLKIMLHTIGCGKHVKYGKVL